MIAFLVVLPILLIAAAWVAATVSVRRSSLSVTPAGVVVRNHRRPEVTVPIVDADRFEDAPRSGPFAALGPRTCVLVRRDGTRITVRATAAPEAGIGVDALNARLRSLRTG